MKQLKLGFLTEHGESENHSQMMYGVFEAAKRYNANVIRFATKTFYEDYNRYNSELNNLYKIIEAQKLDGIMFLGWMPGLVGKYFNDFLKRFSSIPLVSLGTGYDNIPNVYANPEKCIKELLQHMIEVHRRKRIVFVPPSIADIRNMVYKEVMHKYGLYHNELIINTEDFNGISVEERMKKVLSILTDERKTDFDAILVMFDKDARNLIKELKIRKINVPADLSVASYEDTEFANYSRPPLTTISFPWREVGFHGCEKIIKLINNEPMEFSTAIISKLILRNSCGCSSNRIKLSIIECRPEINSPTQKVHFKHILDFYDEIREAFPYTHIKIKNLLYSLIKDFEGETTTSFLTEFEYQLQEIVSIYPYLDIINEIEELVYYLRNKIVTYIANDSRFLLFFEDIMHKVQVIIKEKAITIIGFGQVQLKIIDQELHYISQKLIDTFNIKELLNVLENNLAKLEIPSCYIFLFNKSSSEDCTLIFNYEDNKRVVIYNTSVTTKYISDNIIEKHKKVLCQLLFVNNNYLGFIVFEPSVMDERIYQSLSIHVSSALKGAILLENLTEEITLRKEKEKQLTNIVNYDSLSGLFNRRYFYQIINYIIDNKSCNNHNGNGQKVSFFLLFIDIDGFKQVNDSLGHDIGDLLLVEISKRLKANLNGISSLIPEVLQNFNERNMKETIFRFGGDEFTAIVSGISIKEMEILAEKIIYKVKAPYYINKYEINISCSIGISIYPDHANNTEMLIKYADIAMYNAKKQRDMYCFFDKLDQL